MQQTFNTRGIGIRCAWLESEHTMTDCLHKGIFSYYASVEIVVTGGKRIRPSIRCAFYSKTMLLPAMCKNVMLVLFTWCSQPEPH